MGSLVAVLVMVEQSAVAEIKKIATAVETTVISEVQLFVAKAKETDLGTRAMNLISDLESTSLAGADKMTKLLGDLEGDAVAFVANGGPTGLVVSAESFLKEFAQSAVNDFKQAAGAALKVA